MLKYLLFFFLHLFYAGLVSAQSTITGSEILSPQEINKIFSPAQKEKLNITNPVLRAYRYQDKSGHYICVLTQSQDSIGVKDTFNYSIKAINLKVQNDQYVAVWELNDHIIKNANEENSIWFWANYCEFKDVDNDGLIDPVIVYGTSAMNGLDDGRIKIVVYNKGKKTAIRHQNAVLDDERKTLVDKSFYALPAKIKAVIKLKMARMEEKGQAIFTVQL
jgi:hypothetical protein